MKYAFFFILTLMFTYGHAQQTKDYKYIQVPEQLSGFNDNQYQLNFYLKQLLRKNNYSVLNEDRSSWPQQAQDYPCSVLKADITKVKKFLKNALVLKFTDCNGNVVGSYEGDSKIKEYHRGYQEALRIAMKQAGAHNPDVEALLKIAIDSPENETNTLATNHLEIQPQGNVSENSLTELGKEFSSGDWHVILTELKNGSLLLFNKSDSGLIAQLLPSSRNGVYQVTVVGEKEKYSTTGFYENDSLVIDFIERGRTNTIEFKKVN